MHKSEPNPFEPPAQLPNEGASGERNLGSKSRFAWIGSLMCVLGGMMVLARLCAVIANVGNDRPNGLAYQIVIATTPRQVSSLLVAFGGIFLIIGVIRSLKS